jgi:hypothetical protein
MLLHHTVNCDCIPLSKNGMLLFIVLKVIQAAFVCNFIQVMGSE